MIRSLCLNAFIFIDTLIFCLWGLIIVLFFRRRGIETCRLVEIPWARSILWGCGIKVRVIGRENVQRDTAYVFMSNHQSYFDVFVLLAGIPTEFKFVLKKELMKIFPLGIAMRKVGQISIDRHSSKNAADSLNRAAAKMKAGMSVLIFPEGTRSPDGRLGAFKKGGGHLALKSGCEIVPVAVKDTRRIALKGRLRINKFRATLIIGSPIPVKGRRQQDISELVASIRSAILNMLGQGGESGA